MDQSPSTSRHGQGQLAAGASQSGGSLLQPRLPPRPSQPLRPICRYISEFILQNRGNGDKANARHLFTQASRQWKELSDEEKSKYVDPSRKEWLEYFKNVQTWKDQVAEFKRPAPPFALFLKDVWNCEMKLRRTGKPPSSFTQISKKASDLWNNRNYKRRYEEDRKNYLDKIRRLSQEQMKQPATTQSQPELKAQSLTSNGEGSSSTGDKTVNEIYNNPSAGNPSVEDMDFNEEELTGNPLNSAESLPEIDSDDSNGSLVDDVDSEDEYNNGMLAKSYESSLPSDAAVGADGDGHAHAADVHDEDSKEESDAADEIEE